MDKRFVFSIVMSVYNVADYLKEAVDSIIAQTIGFEQNVQIVFVNDGSEDESGALCKAYRERYPENIVYVEQENKGLSVARNRGVSLAEGRYINFFDPDDILSLNALQEVRDFMAQHESMIDFATVPLVYFEAQKGLHEKYKPLGKKNRVVNLLDNPTCFVLSSAGSFYKSSVFERYSFDETLFNLEDAKLNMSLMKVRPQFGYVCEKGVKYNYRKREAGGSNVDRFASGTDLRALYSPVDLLDSLYPDVSSLREYEKEFGVYVLRPLLKLMRRESFDDEGQYQAVLDRCKRFARGLDIDFVMRKSLYLDNSERKSLFLQLKGTSFLDLWNQGRMSASRFKIRIKSFKVSEGAIWIDVLFNNFGCPFDVVVLRDDGSMLTPEVSKDINSPFDVAYGEFFMDCTHFRRFRIPLNAGSALFAFIAPDSGELYYPSTVAPSHKPPLMSLGADLGVRRFGKFIYLKGNRLIIENNRESAFAHGLKTMRSIKKHSNIIAWLRPLARDEKKYVLIGDRPSKAGDNGQALFEHIMTFGSGELKKVTYFVLDKKSHDYRRMKNKRHVVQPGSLKHKLLLLNARLVYSSHNARKFYLPFAHNGKYYADEFAYQFVWLQHGITKDDISKQASSLQTEDSYITTASDRERREFMRETYFYDANQILLTGFSRYDKLKSQSKRIITIAPTWRSSLSGPIRKDGYHEPISGFEESEWYMRFSHLLGNERFLNLLRKSNYSCHFVCHPGFKCYEKLFEGFKNDCVEILHQEDADYSRIFAESSVFVTDYSSTAFDFAYLRKPVLYYQFDSDDYQYATGYFSYEEDGFGPVVCEEEDLIDYIEGLLENEARIEKKYLDRINSFFMYVDQSNSKRILHATLPNDLLFDLND